VIDTENGRACHYADRFRFRHVPFAAPFDPLSYLAAIEHCVRKGAGVVVIDSMSHEHEGPGGVLDMHDKVVEEKGERHSMIAWAKPKAMRRRLLNTILQIPCNFVFCFRAKEKLKIAKGKDPEKLGIMPIAGEEFVYEMTAQALLMPGAGGVPTWMGAEVGERMMIKLPEQFRQHFLGKRTPLDEADGEFMARWALGDATPAARRHPPRTRSATPAGVSPRPRPPPSSRRSGPRSPAGTRPRSPRTRTPARRCCLRPSLRRPRRRPRPDPDPALAKWLADYEAAGGIAEVFFDDHELTRAAFDAARGDEADRIRGLLAEALERLAAPAAE
jgi:hypothetical protein